MAIILHGTNQADHSIVLDKVVIQANCFELRSSTRPDASIGVRFPYGRKEEYDVNDAVAILATNPFHLEASVMEFFCQPGKKRLGYVFSYNSAGSTNHKFSECPHFRKAAYAGVYHTLWQLVNNDNFEIRICPNEGCIEFSELLDGNLVIFAIHKPFLEAASVRVDQLFCDLSRFGYLKAEETPFESPCFGRIIEDNFKQSLGEEKLKARRLEAPLCSDQIIERFLGKNIIYPTDSVLRFFYHYQILERVMDMEMRVMVKDLVETTLSKNINLIDAYETQDRIGQVFSGKKKMVSIIASKSNFSRPDSIIAFKSFLNECSVSIPDGYVDCLYKVRNVIIHCWWSASIGARARLSEVVACFENDLMEILLNYSDFMKSVKASNDGDFSI